MPHMKLIVYTGKGVLDFAAILLQLQRGYFC